MEERSKPVKTKKGPRPLTQPMSPKLSTRLRSKPVKIPTREERELEELQKIKPVKARPLNRKILESNEPLGVPPPMKQPLTIPQSPAIHKPGPKEIEPSPPRIVKANPVPDLSKPFQPQIETRKIVPDEFRLPGEEISQKKRSKIQQKLLEEQEEMEKAKQFHAQPLPQFKDPKLEHKIQVTEPSPFLLETELRGMQKEQQLQKQLLELEQKRKEEAHFKAHPLPKLDPFVPQKSDKPLTEVVDPQLNTEMRAEERKEFDLQIQRRLQDEEEAKQRLLQQQEVQNPTIGGGARENQTTQEGNRTQGSASQEVCQNSHQTQ
ncbi:hypothetical protein EDD86DRAFT_144063 [Gorgonomyces haynaldii]|nr:hypothetical protein EDD86DRAFT_144063 [Gorgonomyces haynaldii]